MGRGRQKRDAFLRQHRICCFCAGSRAAVEEEHFPSKALFRGRQWPEGYVFPACAACNRITSRDELIVAWLARARVRDARMSKIDQEEFDKLCAGVRREFPGMLESMQSGVTHRSRREARGKLGLQVPEGGSLLDLPILSVADDRIQNAVFSFGRKFGLALFYKHFSSPMPSAGAIGLRWYSNLQVETGEIPSTLSEVLPDLPTLARAKIDLSDQFSYRVGIAEGEEKRVGAFRADFHTSFSIVGFFSDQRAAVAGDGISFAEGARVYSPIAHG